MSTLSPELLDVSDVGYNDFLAGNVLIEPLPEIIRRSNNLSYIHEFVQGLEKCKATCDFFEYCQGAHAGNRYFEHGTFTATETEHCRTSFQAPILGLLDLIKKREIEP